MDTPTFRKLLRALKTLTPCQLRHLDKERQLQTDNETRLDKRQAAEFANIQSVRTVNQKWFIVGEAVVINGNVIVAGIATRALIP